MNKLTPFLGKVVIVQMNEQPWMSCHVVDGAPAVSRIKGEDGSPTIVPAPFIAGKVVDLNGVAVPEAPVPDIQGSTQRMGSVLIGLGDDAIFAVNAAVEKSRLIQ